MKLPKTAAVVVRMTFLRLLLNGLAAIALAISLWALLTAFRVWGAPDMGPIAGLLSIFLHAVPAFAFAVLCFVGARVISARQKAALRTTRAREGWSMGRLLIWLGAAVAILLVLLEAATTPWGRLGDLYVIVIPMVLANAVPGLLLVLIGYWLQGRKPHQA